VAVPYASIHHLYHDHYAGGVKIAEWAKQLHRNARLMLERTAIVPNLARAHLLLDVLERLGPTSHASETQQSQVFGIFGLLTECYTPVADDVLVTAAFEIHAKAKLLNAGYIIHNIRKPAHLRKRQKDQPIHVRTVRAMMKRGNDVLFDRTTLRITTLLQESYIRHYPLSAVALIAFDEVRRRRNLVHFAEPYTWGIDRNLLELVDHLNGVVPLFPKPARRRRSRPSA